MAYYKKQKIKGKWYPRSVTVGRPADIDEVAQRLSSRSTVSRGDTYAVLAELGGVLSELMNEGRSVRLEGVGTFYLSCNSSGQGVDTPEEVGPDQIRAAKVRFIPEYSRGQRGQVVKRTLVSPTCSGPTWRRS